ncbi:MAG: M23 family metallopeptidase [Desulfobulbaceae bacterium]|jgi:murein DD-endopeptidase MepM/ murein hydrolase activator NlpD|nr:M23 family metallopeptidase [Desulfobulbaceae bacterium]
MTFSSMQNNPTTSAKRRLSPALLITCAVIALIVIALFFLFFEAGKPTITLENDSDSIGRNSTIAVTVKDEKSGLRRVKIEAIQGNLTKELLTRDYPRHGYIGLIGPVTDHLEALFTAPNFGFKEGNIELVITAHGYSLLSGFGGGNMTVLRKTVRLDTKPPVISLVTNKPFITPGGSGLVVYKLDKPVREQGVLLNGRLFPGFPLPGVKDGYVCYFALPYDAAKLEQAALRATDLAGNTTLLGLAMRFKSVKWKDDKIPVSDTFLTMKLPEFEQHYPEMHGTPLEQYIYVNGEVRRANEKKINELCGKSDEKRLWSGAFVRAPGSAPAGFADQRAYVYNGSQFDKQVHLGMDIASLAHAQIRAANAGTVVFADYMGIYGNMVLLDHGQGIFSLYAHMSQINAKVGDAVTKNTVLGLTGATGMAGGDHLHFSMLVHGVFVTPIEWWDPHWIQVNIDEPLAQASGQTASH